MPTTEETSGDTVRRARELLAWRQADARRKVLDEAIAQVRENLERLRDTPKGTS